MATSPATAAASARNLSMPLRAGAAAGAGRCAAGLGWATGADVALCGAAAAGAGLAAAELGNGMTLGAPVGPPGGNVGSLMVGAADGLGGSVMRTVSFLGWTLPVSFFGGTAPAGIFGIFGGTSAICVGPKDKSPPTCVNQLNAKNPARTCLLRGPINPRNLLD